jgi:hypothetical protein
MALFPVRGFKTHQGHHTAKIAYCWKSGLGAEMLTEQ